MLTRPKIASETLAFMQTLGDSGSQVSAESKHSGFERITKLWLPSLSLIALIVTQLMGKQPGLSWVLMGVTILLVGLSYTPELGAWLRRRRERTQDDIAAKNAFPEFREFVRRFEAFVDNRRNDTLHVTLTYELSSGRANYPALKLPHLDLWHGHLDYFAQRLNRQPLNMTEFRAALMEFHFLVGTYNNHCVAQIFETLPKDVTAALASETKNNLNLFQQRFLKFLIEYQDFAKPLSESRPALHGLPCFFSMPKPLS